MAGCSRNLAARVTRRPALPATMSGSATRPSPKSSAEFGLTEQRAKPKSLTFTRTMSARRNRRATRTGRWFGSGAVMPLGTARSTAMLTAMVKTQSSVCVSRGNIMTARAACSTTTFAITTPSSAAISNLTRLACSAALTVMLMLKGIP